MKTLTLTLAVTTGAPMPLPPQGSPPFGLSAGFRITVERVGTTAKTVLPVENKLVWVMSNFVEGAEYAITLESVDVNGASIHKLAPVVFNVPGAPPVAGGTYARIDTFSMAWSDQ